MKINQILKEIGLTDREIRVYIFGLKTGPIRASRLAEKMKIDRVNLYGILKSLQQKGLTSQNSKSYDKCFIMEPLANLKNKIERQIDQKKIVQVELDKVLQTLKFLTPISESIPHIKIFEGKEGIINILQEVYKIKERKIQTIQGSKDIEGNVSKEIIKKILEKRVAKGIINQALKKRSFDQSMVEERKRELRDTRYLPEKFNFDATMIIFSKKVAIISSKVEDFGFTIQSEELVHFFKVLFEMLWEVSNKPGK